MRRISPASRAGAHAQIPPSCCVPARTCSHAWPSAPTAPARPCRSNHQILMLQDRASTLQAQLAQATSSIQVLQIQVAELKQASQQQQRPAAGGSAATRLPHDLQAHPRVGSRSDLAHLQPAGMNGDEAIAMAGRMHSPSLATCAVADTGMHVIPQPDGTVLVPTQTPDGIVYVSCRFEMDHFQQHGHA
eukprot:102080-Chlamydomonas_euryale.AAC.1